MAANPFLQVCVCVFGGGGAENFTGGGYFLLGGGTGSGTIFTIWPFSDAKNNILETLKINQMYLAWYICTFFLVGRVNKFLAIGTRLSSISP